MQRIRLLRGNWERSRDGETYHKGDVIDDAADSEVAYLNRGEYRQAQTIEYVDPSEVNNEGDTSIPKYSVPDLNAMDHDQRKEIYLDLGGDPDNVDLRKTDAVIEGIQRLQEEA